MKEFIYSLPKSWFKNLVVGKHNKAAFKAIDKTMIKKDVDGRRTWTPTLSKQEERKIIDDMWIECFLVELFTFLGEK